LRDNYLRTRVFEVDKYPTLEFVAKRAPGVPVPLPGTPQTQANGFQLVGDMTLHGVTKEVSWNLLITVRGAAVAGRAMTTLTFQQFNLMKPMVPFLLSADDKIQLEVEFRCNRTAV
jgi:polyisoprenoid-binding protein YceI